MTFGALLATGLVAVLAVMVAVVVFVPRLRIIAAYTISLPACVLASLLVFGFIRLDWWPAWSSRPLMYLSAPLAAVTVLMLLVTGMFRIFGGPLNWRYVLNATYGLTHSPPVPAWPSRPCSISGVLCYGICWGALAVCLLWRWYAASSCRARTIRSTAEHRS